MNVKLQYDLEFLAGIYYNDQLQFNSYSVSVGLLTQTTDTASSNIALERVKAFVYSELADTVFFGPKDREKADLYQMLGTNVTTLPDEPIDQIIGIMLYCKLNAVMENRMIVTRLDISSALGDSVWYTHDDEDNLGPFAVENAWWHNSTTQHVDDAETTPNNIVKVITSAWNEYGLTWPEERADATPAKNTVIYSDFRRHETK